MLQIAEKYPIDREAFANPLIQEAVQEFRRFQSDPAMQELERQRHLFMVGYNEDLTVSRAQGIAQGKAEGIAEGEVRGELKSRVDDILDILNDKFEQIPQHIVDSLNQQTDAVALKSLVRRAAKCTSLDEFAADL